VPPCSARPRCGGDRRLLNTAPALVIALLIGLRSAPGPRASRHARLVWCGKTLLRVAIAILVLRISLADIIGLGPALC